MSSGFVHSKASLMLAAGFSVGALVSQDPKILVCTLGALTGIMLSPDLDVDNGNISEKIIKQKVGWFGARLWKWFWSGYSGSFKHGQFGSHFPVFSTAIRLAYIYFWVLLPFYSINYFFLGNYFNTSGDLDWWARTIFNPFFLYGLCSADTIHFFLDILTTEHKSN